MKAGQDFFPLTVDYLERTYAAGKIPGGFFKREGKQSEKEHERDASSCLFETHLSLYVYEPSRIVYFFKSLRCQAMP